MSLATLACAGAISVFALMPAIAGKNGPIKVACVDDYVAPKFKKKPRHCRFVKRGETANAYAIQMKRMTWRFWGHRRAVGKGVTVASMSGPIPAKVELRGLRARCGRTVYSKARLRSRYGTGRWLHIDTC